VVGARQQAASAAADASDVAAAGAAAMESDDFPAEAHAALDLLDQRLSSLRRQLVALQKPAAQAAMQRMQAVRVPGYRGPSGQQRRGGGGFTPRGTPRSGGGGGGGGSLYRDSSLGKRRRAQVRAARFAPPPHPPTPHPPTFQQAAAWPSALLTLVSQVAAC
jgi:hypothetical protein